MTRAALLLAPARGDRVAAQELERRGIGARIAAAGVSLLVHGAALAAILIAIAGTPPSPLPPAIEVAVVVEGAAPPGAAAAAARPRTPHTATPMPARPPAAAAASTPVARPVAHEDRTPAATPIPAAPGADALRPALPHPVAAAPPPPSRKPPQPDAQAAMPPPAVERPAPAHLPAPQRPQLAAMPEGEAVDSAALPGAAATPPRFQGQGLANPWPRYPEAARRHGVEGRVLVRVRVTAAGAVADIGVVGSSGSGELDRAALEALARWRFAPARAAGVPVPATIDIPVSFRLTDRPPG